MDLGRLRDVKRCFMAMVFVVVLRRVDGVSERFYGVCSGFHVFLGVFERVCGTGICVDLHQILMPLSPL